MKTKHCLDCLLLDDVFCCCCCFVFIDVCMWYTFIYYVFVDIEELWLLFLFLYIRMYDVFIVCILATMSLVIVPFVTQLESNMSASLSSKHYTRTLLLSDIELKLFWLNYPSVAHKERRCNMSLVHSLSLCVYQNMQVKWQHSKCSVATAASAVIFYVLLSKQKKNSSSKFVYVRDTQFIMK